MQAVRLSSVFTCVAIKYCNVSWETGLGDRPSGCPSVVKTYTGPASVASAAKLLLMLWKIHYGALDVVSNRTFRNGETQIKVDSLFQR